MQNVVVRHAADHDGGGECRERSSMTNATDSVYTQTEATGAESAWWEPAEKELAAQRAAREAIQAIPIFPDLERRLIAEFGATPEAIMLHQFVYWLRKPAMEDRDWLYKTFSEWREERGLSRRQVDKGRAALRKAGIIEEAKGPYKLIHFRFAYVRLAERLNLTLNPIAHPKPDENGIGTAQTPENERAVSDCPPENGHKPHSYAGKPPEEGGQSRLPGPNTENPAYLRGKPPEEGGQSNTGEYAGDYLHRSSLQEGSGGSQSRTAPGEKGEQKEPEHGDTLTDFGAMWPSHTPQQDESANGHTEDDALTDNAADPPMADAARVARARAALDALLGDWPGHGEDARAGKWPELAMTLKQLEYAEERFTPVEVMLGARSLEVVSEAAGEPRAIREAAYG